MKRWIKAASFGYSVFAALMFSMECIVLNLTEQQWRHSVIPLSNLKLFLIFAAVFWKHFGLFITLATSLPGAPHTLSDLPIDYHESWGAPFIPSFGMSGETGPLRNLY